MITVADAGLNAGFADGSLSVRSPALAVLPIPALLHQGEDESIRLAIELGAGWLLMDDLRARRAALANLAAAGVDTGVKGTLGVIVSAYQRQHLTRQQAVTLIDNLKARPDVWLNSDLCDRVTRILQTN